MADTEIVLEIHRLKETMEEMAYTQVAKQRIRNLTPYMEESSVKAALRETTEARLMLMQQGNPPMDDWGNIEEILTLSRIGSCLTVEQLERIRLVLVGVKRMKDYLNRSKYLGIGLPYYEEELEPAEELREEIGRCIRGNQVADTATKTLKDIRTEEETLERKIREKAEAVLRANKSCMSDHFYTVRQNRICLPVKKEYKYKIPGSVVDQSSTGSTLFIEPASVAKLAEELELLRLAEENEVMQILYTLTGMTADAADTVERNQKVLERLDFAFVKGKMSLDLGGTEPEITMEREIYLKQARHPLMDRKFSVPLDFSIKAPVSGVVITGPNTGGKTVAIKTVGISCYLAQCGLHIPCEKARIGMVNGILCDIGDGQSLSENLSTFSSHITNILSILNKAGRESLVILDELGSGTDPAEGMGIAIAVLDELRKRKCMFLVTTHYPEVKEYAQKTEGVLNARMAFDRESLKPLYRLELGKAGDSCAFYIAARLGMPKSMLERAALAAGSRKEEQKDWLAVAADRLEAGKADSLPRLKGINGERKKKDLKEKFHRGDSVMVYPDKKIGIVCQEADDRGMVRVQMPGKKITVGHKRLKVLVEASELYPEDYDFSIVFDSVKNRKAHRLMDRKHAEGVEVRVEKEDLWG